MLTSPAGAAGSSDSAGPALAAYPLTRAILEIDEYAAGLGWDQPARLFALVDNGSLGQYLPALQGWEGVAEPLADGLTAVRQNELPAGARLDDFLATIAWPESVAGCAVVVERLMLPPAAEAELAALGTDADLAAWVAGRPDRQEIRMTVGVLRDGTRQAAIRLRSKDTARDVLTGADLVPGLADALAATFAAPPAG